MNTQSCSGPSALTIVLYTLAAVAFLLALVLMCRFQPGVIIEQEMGS